MRSRVVVVVLVVVGVGLLVVQLALAGVAPSREWFAHWWPALAGAVVLLVAGWLLLRARSGGGEGRQPHDWARTTGLVTALTAVGALVFTGLSLQATRRQVAVGEQAQLSDRFLRAVEQLADQGEGRTHLRLGGIYALERVAVDSPRDQPVVEELLAAFIRDRSPRGAERACPKTAVDVSAAFEVLARRPALDTGRPIDLQGTCLVGVNAPNGDLSRMSLAGADLTEANFYGANVQGLTSFVGATLVRARFGGAKFGPWVFLKGADLTGADLGYADLSGVSLDGVNLSGADLSGARHSDSTDVSTAVKDAATKGAWW